MLPTDTPSPLAAAAEAVSDDTRDPSVEYREHCRVSLDAIRALRTALASDAAWRARAEAAVEVAEAVWAVDVAWMAYEPSDDPNAEPNASQRRHTAAVERLRAARRRYEEAARG